ncbi:MAG: hypothetical protein PHY45_07145 [Rhodocyclaceae bacterium]|nr:hypothetical protein [Rhodocyclaceae bacterium]
MAFDIVWEARGAYKKFCGHVADDELLQSVRELHGDARFDDVRYVINDFLPIDSFAIAADTVLYIAAIDHAAARSNANIKIAVVTTDPQAAALAELYIASPLHAYPTRVFATLAEARAWV